MSILRSLYMTGDIFLYKLSGNKSKLPVAEKRTTTFCLILMACQLVLGYFMPKG